MSPVQLQLVDRGMSRDTMTKLPSEPCALYMYMLSMSVQVVSNASLLGVITSWFVALPGACLWHSTVLVHLHMLKSHLLMH